jgi:hypothetical protein
MNDVAEAIVGDGVEVGEIRVDDEGCKPRRLVKLVPETQTGVPQNVSTANT